MNYHQVCRVDINFEKLSSRIEGERSPENKLKDVIYSIQVCIDYSEGKHISNDSKYSFIYSRASFEALYIAANLCFKAKLNHPIVSEVMQRILKTDGTFESFFYDIIVYGWETFLNLKNGQIEWATVSQKESLDLIEYLFNYASMARLLLEKQPLSELCSKKRDSRRFVDIPVDINLPIQSPPIGIAIMFDNHKMLLIFLRYGAQLTFTNPLYEYFNAVDYVINSLFHNFFMTRRKVLKRIPRFEHLSLTYIMRTVPSINTKVWANCERMKGTNRDDIKTFTDFITAEMIPPSRSGTQPPELKHLTRLAIRQVLNANWSLPSGIYTLGLPRSLEEYLDLLQD